ncbi:MAG: T9SS type A sorting domain-containing protein [Chitinophagales bacterium]|nr:T9SS type A sorting domain-containing protein [Chitinophagales bacterium]
MKKYLLLGLTFISAMASAQSLVSYNLIKTYSTGQIDSVLSANGIPPLFLPTTYDIDIYKVVYNTLDADSLPIIASGALFIPKNNQCKAPLMSYQHGTISVKTAVPSTLNSLEVLIGETSASDGAVVTMPDYLGLGDSPGLHPYMNAETEARATADLLVVAKEICSDLGVVLNDQLFLLGYSQGGHSTMAAHQMIQESYGNYFKVTASVPMSGPYDVSGLQAQTISQNVEYPNPGYLPYFLLAYNSVYHIYASNSDFLASPYDVTIPPLFDGTHELSEVNAIMPSIPNQILVPALLDSFNTYPDYRLYKYLKLNDTYNWKADAPIRMFYCEADMDVNYLNSFVAYDTLTANGSVSVSKFSSGPLLDHSGCVFPSLLSAKAFIDSFRLDKLKFTFDITNCSTPFASDGSVTVHASSGFAPYTYLWSNGTTDSTLSNVPLGFYTITVTDATGCPNTTSVFVSVQVGIEEVFAQQTSVTPNPMHNFSTIQFPEAGNYSVELSDATGRLIMNENFYGDKYILLRRNLSSGIYYLKMKQEEGVPFIKMIVAE